MTETDEGILVAGQDEVLPPVDEIIVATPCVEFSRYALDYPADQPPDRRVADTVAFLNNGVRGFYGAMRETATIRVGDRVFLRA